MPTITYHRSFRVLYESVLFAPCINFFFFFFKIPASWATVSEQLHSCQQSHSQILTCRVLHESLLFTPSTSYIYIYILKIPASKLLLLNRFTRANVTFHRSLRVYDCVLFVPGEIVLL